MGYRKAVYESGAIGGVEKYEGEPIEIKVERIMQNKEPIKDGAPEIYTERKEGVIPAYNIRTCRFEIAAEAMDVVGKSIQAKRDARQAKKEENKTETVKEEKINVVEPVQGGGKNGSE